MTSDASAYVRQLVADYLDDEPSAMLALERLFRGRVFGLCYRMLGQWQDAEDAVQETFLRVSRSLSKWDSAREFEPWLMTIAANRCRSHLARRQRRLDTQPLTDQETSRVSSPYEGLGPLAEEIDRAIAAMPAERSAAFRLFHQEGLSYDEISRQLARPPGTIKTWVHRTRRALIETLRRRDVIED